MKLKNEWIILIALSVLFMGFIFIPRIFTGFDLAFQLTAACLGAFITMIITRMLLKNQSASEEEKEKNIRIYENKIKVYSNFISTMWKTLEDEEVTEEELRILRSEIYNELIFYISPYKINALKACVDAMFAAKEKVEKNDSNIGALTKEYTLQFSNITKILREDLNGISSSNDTNEENAEQILKLWTSFKILPTEDVVPTPVSPAIQTTDTLQEIKTEEIEAPQEKSTSFNGQFWHFNMWGYDQLRALKQGKYELSLVEYGESWRTNLVRKVKTGDIVFLFRRGGWGYIGAYRVLGYRVMDFDSNTEQIVLNGKAETKNPIPENDIIEYDYYKSKEDGADLCTNIIVEQLAYYDNGVSYPGGVYRRTISRYDYGYGKILLSRLFTRSKDSENFGWFHESDNTSTPMTCNMDGFKELVNALNIKPAELDANGNWK